MCYKCYTARVCILLQPDIVAHVMGLITQINCEFIKKQNACGRHSTISIDRRVDVSRDEQHCTTLGMRWNFTLNTSSRRVAALIIATIVEDYHTTYFWSVESGFRIEVL